MQQNQRYEKNFWKILVAMAPLPKMNDQRLQRIKNDWDDSALLMQPSQATKPKIEIIKNCCGRW
jgi:hypothetical protein